MIALLLACRPEPAPPPDEWGPHGPGATTVQWVDPRGKELTLEVWYPAVPGGRAGPYPPTTLALDAVRDAEPAEHDGPWPLVAFSHGNVAVRFQSAFLCEHLASHGFVVVAPDHRHNTLLDLDEDELTNVILERPDDIRYAVDGLGEVARRDGVLEGLAEAGPYAVMGHSFGGFTSLIVGGGDLDAQAAIDFCDAGGESPACDVLTQEVVERADEHGQADDRVVATVSMSPLAWYAFRGQGDGLQSVRNPMIVGGRLDSVTEWDLEIEPIYERLSSPRTLLEFPRAGHYSFSDICLLAPNIFPECGDLDQYADLLEVQRLTKRAVTAFLKVQLEEDERYAEFLEPEAYDDSDEVLLRSE